MNRYDGYGRFSSYGVRDSVYAASVDEARHAPYANFGYGFGAGYGLPYYG